VNDWSGLFLAVIAVATLVMALIQVGAVIAVLRLARQAQEAVVSVQRDVQPLLAKVNAIADEASKTATLAAAQAQKIDKLVTDLSRRVDETSSLVQHAILTPAREGIAVIAGIKAALGVFRDLGDFRGRTRRQAEEEDPLFIG
jgi:predicted PurR-regulated permease PerM